MQGKLLVRLPLLLWLLRIFLVLVPVFCGLENFMFHVLVAKKPLVASDTSWIVRFDSAGCQCGCCCGDIFT
jgi:hypothetical protein